MEKLSTAGGGFGLKEGVRGAMCAFVISDIIQSTTLSGEM